MIWSTLGFGEPHIVIGLEKLNGKDTNTLGRDKRQSGEHVVWGGVCQLPIFADDDKNIV